MSETEVFLRNAMENHGGAVYRLALCRLQCTQDAEDVYQEVFLRLLGQGAESWETSHIKAWLIRTTLNRCHDLTRFRLRRPALALDEVPEVAAAAGEEWSDLWEAVARLPEKLRVVIHLFYAEEYSTEQIAALLNCAAATVRSRLHRARRQLKDLLGGIDDETHRLSNADDAYSRACRLK